MKPTGKQPTNGTAKRKPDGVPKPSRLAAVVAGQAKLMGERLLDEDLDPKRRAEIESRLKKAYLAMRPTWKASTLQSAIVLALKTPTKFLRAGVWSEEWAITRATEQIVGALNDLYAPAEHYGKKPPRRLVINCLRSPPPRRGRPVGDVQTRYEALLELFRALGVSGANDARAVSKTLERKRR
jgi:hypothetical protein